MLKIRAFFRNVLKMFSIFVVVGALDAVSVQFGGSSAAWTGYGFRESIFTLGVTFLPQVFISACSNSSYSIDFDAEVLSNLRGSVGHGEPFTLNARLYRGWIRFTSGQLESRLGLQKIAFGSATILRPLMWFDTMDPGDPMMLTDGVWAWLWRYSFLNNTEMSGWIVRGDGKRRGFDLYPTQEGTVEYGGRVQIPVFTGQMAFTFDRRRPLLTFDTRNSVHELKISADGKWDVGVGLWFEAVAKRLIPHAAVPQWQKALSVGTDYTFPVGNGFYLMGEFMVMGNSLNDLYKVAAISADYPLSLTDRVSTIWLYDVEKEDFSVFLKLERDFDRFSGHLMFFTGSGQSLFPHDNALSGSGIMLMLSLDF